MSQLVSHIIDTTVPETMPVDFFGPIYWTAGRVYSFGLQTPTLALGHALVYKSVDGGATWSKPDEGNAPAMQVAAFYFDGVNPTCYILYRLVGGGNTALRIITFDLNTETYGAVQGAAGAPLAAAIGSITLMADGTLICLYERNTVGIVNRVFLSVFSAGAWGAETDIGTNIVNTGTPAADVRWEEVIPDPANNLVHLWYSRMPFTSSYFYRQVHSNSSLGTVTSFAGDNIHIGALNLGRALDPGYIRAGDLHLPVFRLDIASSRIYLDEMVGSPASSATPAFTFSGPIDPDFLGDPSGNVVPGAAIGFAIGTIDYIAYFCGDAAGNAYAEIRLAQNSGAGWSRNIVYNATLDPNAAINPFTSQWINTISAGPDPSGGPQYQWSMWHVYPSDANLTTFSTSASVLLECGNPPDGGVGSPYSHTFSASGGTAPYTYAITAGALPTGLTLDAATGTISGTPTATGTFPFTVQATDSLGGMATVECVIDIVGSVGVQMILGGVKRRRVQ